MSFESGGSGWNPSVQGTRFGSNKDGSGGYHPLKRRNDDDEFRDAFVHHEEDTAEIEDISVSMSFIKLLAKLKQIIAGIVSKVFKFKKKKI